MRFLLDSQTRASSIDLRKDTILSQSTVSGELISSRNVLVGCLVVCADHSDLLIPSVAPLLTNVN